MQDADPCRADQGWHQLLEAFEAEAGDPLSDEPEGWEHCLLAKLASRQLRKPKSAKRLERQLLEEGQTREDCRRVLERLLSASAADEVLPAVAEAKAAISEVFQELSRNPRPRSRSARRQRDVLGRARLALRAGARSCPEAATAAANLLLAGRALGAEGAGSDVAIDNVSAPPCLGPPAFFPVGNAAGRFDPLTRGLDVELPRLLFVGLSDPRHLLASLPALSKSQREIRLSCVLNDLNAETCGRNAIILQLLSSGSDRCLLAAFAFWWTHELPFALLPSIQAAAKAALAGGRICEATCITLQAWLEEWSSASEQNSVSSTELREVLSKAELRDVGMQQAADDVLEPGVCPCVQNISLQHQAARLDYGLHAGRTTPKGFEAAGDGVLLWPEVEESEEFDPDAGQPSREDYLSALAKLLPRFAQAAKAAAGWFESARLEWQVVSGDCLALPRTLQTGGFHRIFTSNVADHVGVPALAMTLMPLLAPQGELGVSLSNSLRAIESGGSVDSLFPKLHGVGLKEAVAALGLRVTGEPCADQVFLGLAADEVESHGALARWPAEAARRLYRCPQPDAKTIRRRMEHGDCLGLAHRYARRFTCSPVTVACIARLLERSATLLCPRDAKEAAAAVIEAAPHSMQRLSQCLRWEKLPSHVCQVMEEATPKLQRLRWRQVSFEVRRESVPGWAWRTHPPVVLLWVRPKGFQSAAAAGVKLSVQDPIWHRCKKASQMAFLDDGVWGPLRWALRASPDEVQVFDGLQLDLQISGNFLVSFALEASELEFGTGSAAFLLSVVDNVILTGPHSLDELRDSAARTTE